MNALYRLTKSQKGEEVRQGDHRYVTREIADDMIMFRDFLADSTPHFASEVPFLIKLGISSDDLELFSDAAGANDLGIGCVFGKEWAIGLWSETTLFSNGYKPNIALLELLAAVCTFTIWAPALSGKSITLRSDNMATVCMLNRMKADIPAANSLLCNLTKTCLKFQIYVRASHVKGELNTLADLIS